MRGKMIWFNENKDHGFIRTDEDERLSVLGSGFAGGVRPRRTSSSSLRKLPAVHGSAPA